MIIKSSVKNYLEIKYGFSELFIILLIITRRSAVFINNNSVIDIITICQYVWFFFFFFEIHDSCLRIVSAETNNIYA